MDTSNSAYNDAVVYQLESMRMHTKKANRGLALRILFLTLGIVLGCAILATVGFMVFAGYYFEEALTTGLIISFFSLIFAVGISIRIYGKKIVANNTALTQAFKEGIVKGELERVFTDVQYEPLGRFSDELIRGLGVIMGIDKILGNDLIHAKRGNVSFAQCELSLQQEVRSKDEDGHTTTTYESRFWGDLVEFETPVTHPARMLLYTNGLQYVYGVKSSMPLAGLLGLRLSDAVVTESDAFNRRFRLACDDQVAARVFFTPQRMAALMELDRALVEAGGKYEKEFAILYRENRMYVFIRGHERFEIDMSAKMPLAQQAQTIAAQANELARRVDLLARDAMWYRLHLAARIGE